MSYPFRLYVSPRSDDLPPWGWRVEVAFAQVPKAPQRLALAKAFADLLAGTHLEPVTLRDHIVWSDRHMAARLRASTSVKGGPAAEQDVKRWIEACHAVVPIEEVLLATDGWTDEVWSQDSRAQRDEPLPRPWWYMVGSEVRAIDEALPPLWPDPDFDRVRREIASTEQEKLHERFMGSAQTKFERAVAKKRLGFEPLPLHEAPLRPHMRTDPAAGRPLRDMGGRPFVQGTRVLARVPRPDGGTPQLHFVDDSGSARAVTGVPIGGAIRVAPDGTWGVGLVRGHGIARIDFQTGEATKIWQPQQPAKLLSLAWGPDGMLWFAGQDLLGLLRLDDEPTLLGDAECGDGMIATAVDGRVAVVADVHTKKKKATWVFAWDGKKMVEVDALDLALDPMRCFEQDGDLHGAAQMFLRLAPGHSTHLVAIHGVIRDLADKVDTGIAAGRKRALAARKRALAKARKGR